MQGVTIKHVPPGMPNAGTTVLRIHYSADDSFTPEKLSFLRSKYTSDARWNREMEIMALALEGELLYPQFSRDRNICKVGDVSDPNYWTIWMGLDPHPRTAHGMVWEAFNKHNDRVVCGSFWPEFLTPDGPTDGVRYMTRDYADAIQLFESDSQYKPKPFEWAKGKVLHIGGRRYMDTFGSAANSDEGEDYFETYRRLGHERKINLNFQPALKGTNNLAKAQDSIARALTASAQGPPMLRIFEENDELIDELENVRFPEGTPERPADERPVTYRKHLIDCVARGSLITTGRGDIPIESVTTDDCVMTRNGLRRVLAAWKVGERDVYRIGDLEVTKDHLVWTERGWIECINLAPCDNITVWESYKQSYGKEKHSTDEADISIAQNSSRYIGQYGRKTMELSHQVARFITRMAIRSTIPWRIWNALLSKNTSASIGVVCRMLQRCASSARKSSLPRLVIHAPDFVPSTVGRLFVTDQEWTMYDGIVLSVVRDSASTDTIRPRPVLRSVALNCKPIACGKATVYDLSVDGEHEFFANGILVHNCLHYIETARPGYVMVGRPRNTFTPIYKETGY